MGLLFDLLGNGAIAGSNLLMQDIKVQQEEEARAKENERMMSRQKELAEYNSKLQQERDRAASELKEEMESKKQQRLVSDTLSARDRAEAIGSDRRFQDFKSKLGQTDATDEELRKAFDEQYDKKVLSVGDKLDAPFVDKGRTASAGDYLKASQETGNSGLIASALKGVDDARQLDKQAFDEAHKERKLKQDAEIAEKKDALGWARIEALVNGKGGKSNEISHTLDLIDSKRKTIASEEDNIIKLIKDATDPTEKAALKKKLDGFAAEREELKSMQKALTARLSGEQPATEKREEPKGYSYLGKNADGSAKYGPSAGRGDPPRGSGNVSSGEQSSQAKLSELQSQHEQLVAIQSNPQTASQKNADVLQAIESQIQRLKSSEPAQGNSTGVQSGRGSSGNPGMPSEFVSKANPGYSVTAKPEPVKTEKPSAASQPEEQRQSAAPSGRDKLMQILNPSGNKSLESIVAPKASQISGIAVMLEKSRQETAAAAKTGDRQALMNAAKEQQAIRSMLDKLLSDMDVAQANAVKIAVGAV